MPWALRGLRNGLLTTRWPRRPDPYADEFRAAVDVHTHPAAAAQPDTQRLAAVAAITRQRKTGVPGSSAALLGPVFRVLAMAGVFGWFIDRQRLINTFLSNLRGPEQRLSFLGAPIVEVIPVSAISGNVTAAFAALSYAERITVTVIADPERCPDLPAIVQALQWELQVLTGSEPPPDPHHSHGSRTSPHPPVSQTATAPVALT